MAEQHSSEAKLIQCVISKVGKDQKALGLDNTLVQAKLNIASIDIEEGLVDKAIYTLKNVSPFAKDA